MLRANTARRLCRQQVPRRPAPVRRRHRGDRRAHRPRLLWGRAVFRGRWPPPGGRLDGFSPPPPPPPPPGGGGGPRAAGGRGGGLPSTTPSPPSPPPPIS